MRNGALTAVFAVSWFCVSPAAGDWLVLRNGERSEVRSIEFRERSVATVTLNGKPWAIAIQLVDVEATRALNGISEDAQLAPERPVSAGPGLVEPADVEVLAPRPTEADAPARRIDPPETQIVLEPPVEVAPLPRPPAERTMFPLEDSVETRFALFVNGVTEPSELRLTETRSFFMFNETGTLDVDYRGTPRSGYELGALIRLRGPLSIIASAEVFESTPSASYSNRLPHPFFFDRLREVSGELPTVSWTERVLHVDPALSFELGPRLSIDLFSGVSLFFTETEHIDEVLYEEVFPYTTVFPLGTTLRRVEGRPIGYNVGASTTFRVFGILGMNFGLRYSHADVHLELPNGQELEFDAGGLRFGAGLKLLFP